jgi:hypothetical protein
MPYTYNGPERRENDHDAITALRQDVRHLCTMVKEVKDDVRKQQEACSCRMKDCNAFFVSQRVFYGALAILIAFVGTVGTVTYNNKTRVESHIQWSVEATKRIDEKFDNLSLPFPPTYGLFDDKDSTAP